VIVDGRCRLRERGPFEPDPLGKRALKNEEQGGAKYQPGNDCVELVSRSDEQ
jgi:hypothetical protein